MAIHNKYSVQGVGNYKEDPERMSTKEHDRYADNRKEK